MKPSKTYNPRPGITRGILALLVLFSTIACQHARVRFDECLNCRTPGEKVSKLEEQTFYAWGWIPRQLEYNVYEICPQGVLEVHEYSTWLDGLLDNATSAIYIPRKLAFTCVGDSAPGQPQSNEGSAAQ